MASSVSYGNLRSLNSKAAISYAAFFSDSSSIQTYQRFSRPVITDDRLNALVWFSHACGSLCGEAGYAWLQRSSTTAEWVVVKRLPKVVS